MPSCFPDFFPYRGGYENSLLALSQYLVQRGHRVTVFTTVANDLEAFWLPDFKTFPEGEISIDGVMVRRFPICYNVLRRRATRLLGHDALLAMEGTILDAILPHSRIARGPRSG